MPTIIFDKTELERLAREFVKTWRDYDLRPEHGGSQEAQLFSQLIDKLNNTGLAFCPHLSHGKDVYVPRNRTHGSPIILYGGVEIELHDLQFAKAVKEEMLKNQFYTGVKIYQEVG